MTRPDRETENGTPQRPPTELAAALRELAAQTEEPAIRFARRRPGAVAGAGATAIPDAAAAPDAGRAGAGGQLPPTEEMAIADRPGDRSPAVQAETPPPVTGEADPDQPASLMPEHRPRTDAHGVPLGGSTPAPELDWAQPRRAPDIAWHRTGAIRRRNGEQEGRRSRQLLADRPWEPAHAPPPAPRPDRRGPLWIAGAGVLTVIVAVVVILLATSGTPSGRLTAAGTPTTAPASTTIPAPPQAAGAGSRRATIRTRRRTRTAALRAAGASSAAAARTATAARRAAAAARRAPARHRRAHKRRRHPTTG